MSVRALIWHGGDALAVEDLPDPSPGPDEVVLKILLAGICGSDLHAYRGHHGARQPPLVLGHEAVGIPVGDQELVCVFPLLACGECAPCLRREENLCDSRILLGLNRPGVFAEKIAVPRTSIIRLPKDMAVLKAALAEPLATVLGALRAVDVRGIHTLVLGCGAIGLLGVHAVASQGAHVVAVDPVLERRLVAEQLGAMFTAPTVEQIEPGSVDLVIDAVGTQMTWTGAIRSVRAGGSVAILGLAESEGLVPVGDLVRRGISVRGHYAYTRSDFHDAIAFLHDHSLPLDWVDEVALADAPAAFQRLVESPHVAIKTMISFSQGSRE